MSDTTTGNRPPLRVAPDKAPTEKEKRDADYRKKMQAYFRTNDLDKKIVSILLENPLATPKQVGALLDQEPARVREALQKPGVRRMLEEANATINDLVKRGQALGLRKLMHLAHSSKDEWVQLQASKILTAAILAPAGKNVVDPMGNGIVYEVQVGANGQVYQTVRLSGDPTLANNNPNKFPTPLQAITEVMEAEVVKE